MCDSKSKTIEIKTENIKLGSFLKLAGAALSGGEAKDMIKSERISVGGEICTSRGKTLVSGDVVSVDGEKFYEVKFCENS